MSRNRLKNSQSLHWMGVLKWILIASLLSMLGLSYMLCKNQNIRLAEETHKLQTQYELIQRRNSQLMLDLGTMKSSRELERRLVQMNSTLVRLPDSRLTMVPMDQHPSMRLVNIGSDPRHTLNPVEAPPVTSSPIMSTSQR
jgi:hypothetical protein